MDILTFSQLSKKTVTDRHLVPSRSVSTESGKTSALAIPPPLDLLARLPRRSVPHERRQTKLPLLLDLHASVSVSQRTPRPMRTKSMLRKRKTCLLRRKSFLMSPLSSTKQASRIPTPLFTRSSRKKLSMLKARRPILNGLTTTMRTLTPTLTSCSSSSMVIHKGTHVSHLKFRWIQSR